MIQDVIPGYAKRLRSLEGRQCQTGYLSRGKGDDRVWDAWGVLCDYGVDEGIIPPPTMTTSSDGEVWLYRGNDPKKLPNTHFPPDEIVAWSALGRETMIRISGHAANIGAHNDLGATFSQIADALEEL